MIIWKNSANSFDDLLFFYIFERCHFPLHGLWQIVACCLFVFSFLWCSFSFFASLCLSRAYFYSVTFFSFILCWNEHTPLKQKILHTINTSPFLHRLLLFSARVWMCVYVWHFFLLLLRLPSTLFELRYYLFIGEKQFLSSSWLNFKKRQKKY